MYKNSDSTKIKPPQNRVLLSMIMPLRLLFFYVAAPPLLFTVIFFNVVENNAITPHNWSLSRVDIQRAKRIVNKTKTQTQQTVKLSTKDLNIALSYLLNHYISSTSLITVKNQQLNFKFSLLLNKHDFGKYLNFSFDLTKKQGYPVINSLKIGQIKIADEFAGLILENIIKHTPLNEYYILVAQHIKDIQINSAGVIIAYSNLPAQLSLEKTLTLTDNNYPSVIVYQQKITQIVKDHDPKWRLSLTDLLQPLFKLAYQRSAKKTAISENRAVLIAVSSYVNNREIQAFLPFDISPNTQTQYSASLYRRTDMAQHFMLSAALAATGAETLAYILGQEKEINDSKRGSGFSFIDLASDRAGLKFGKLAVSSAKKARKLQKRMTNIKDYTAFMPDVRDLPENMNSSVFKQRFESVYSAKYQNMLKMIDRRIATLAIYK